MASKALSNQLAAKDAKKAETEKKKEVIKDTCKKYGACAFILAISLVANIVLTVLQAQGARHYCPDNWIGSNDKCYYFSKEEKDWNSSRYNCTSQHADLAEIDTAEKMGCKEKSLIILGNFLKSQRENCLRKNEILRFTPLEEASSDFAVLLCCLWGPAAASPSHYQQGNRCVPVSFPRG
ncbi:C-type lectin domain family 2 member B isoform X1 [Camelus ferus]|uniref:C-type lectin domain family 2 member B isoform X1 n=2 Tax=Camelus TaxID=9836 RepID=A0A9W3FT32_CAMBA|nr:C-type lectin domain family 2 member B isoform X1 [Camelus ferus]XP_045366179.1 C-type lectin domain family 2 member B isoform X1 [Camelus bactrianus]XP_045366180.1 C-type lectin domain family 2 member B isoform X1 [Camelus bactrianus]